MSKPHASIVVLIVSYETQGSDMPKLIGYARVSTRQQSADRQEAVRGGAGRVPAGARLAVLGEQHGYDRARAVFPEDVLGWLGETQPVEFAKAALISAAVTGKIDVRGL